MLGVVVQIDGFDPVLAQPVTLRAASHDEPAVCHLAGGDPWWPALLKLPTLRYDLFDGAFGADITAPSSSLTIAAAPWPNLGRYALADARLQLWTGDVGAPWGSWTLRFDGRISEQPELADGTASINFAVDDRWLDAALLDTYAGTSGPEGAEPLKGQPKPLALGAPRYAAGTLIDSINSVFQLSAYGPVHGFEAALEKLARYGNTVGDFASYAALVAANVPAGQWATAKSVGMARLGAPPTGQISFLIAGDEAGPNGWARLPGQIIRRLALLSGGAGRINDAALNALDAARPYQLSVYVEQQTTARQLIQQIAASVNAVAGMSWTGQLFVVPVGIAAPTITLAANGSALPPVASVKQIAVAAPFQKLAIGAQRAWTVHALSDIAFTAPLIDVGAYSAATIYREGNIVSLPDGSRWIYVATAPAAGFPPTSSDVAHWSSLNPATKAGDITYADGKSLEELKPAEPGSTNSADPNSPFGGGTVAAAVAKLDKIGPIEARFPPIEAKFPLIESDISALEQATVSHDEALGALDDRLAPAERDISALKEADGRTGAALAALDGVVADQDAAQRQAQRDVGRLEETLLRALMESARTRDVLRDAGIVVDPATGQVRIYAVDQLKDRTSTAEIAIDAVKGIVSTKASVNQVNELIALAVLDPSQVAELGPIIARLTEAESTIDGLNAAVTLKASITELSALAGRTRTAEQSIDALNGTIASKADSTTVDQLGIRLGAAEEVLTALPDTSGYSVAVRQARGVADDTAEAGLRALLAGDAADRYQLTQIAEARQELTVKIADGFSAAAVARATLSVRIDQARALVLDETRASITRDGVLSERIEAQGVVLGNQAAAIGRLDTAAITAAGGIASAQMTIRQQIGTAGESDEALLRALIGADAAGRARAAQLAQVQTEFTTALVANEAALAMAREALLARLNVAEAAIVTTSKVLADTTGAYGSRLSGLETAFGNPVIGLAATRVRINSVEEASARADDALGERIDSIEAVVNDDLTGLPWVRATLTEDRKASVDRDQALAEDIETITAQVNDPESGLAATLAIVTSTARAYVDGDDALSERIDAQGVVLGDQAAAIGRLDTASIDAAGGIANVRMTIRQQVADEDDAGEGLLRALIAGDETGRARAAQLVQVQTDFNTNLVADRLASAMAREALLVRLNAAEAAIVTTSKVLAEADRATASRVGALEVAFDDAADDLGKTRARIVELEEATAKANEAVVKRLDLAEAELTDPETGLAATRATIAQDRQASVDRDEATASDLEQLSALVSDPDTGLPRAQARLDALGEVVADNDAAQARRVDLVAADFGARIAIRPNLQRNGGFEDGPAGIGLPAGVAVADDATYGRVLRWTRGGDTVLFMPPVDVTPGETYTVSFDAKVDVTGGAGEFRLDVASFQGPNGTGTSQPGRFASPFYGNGTSPDVRRYFSFVAPADCRSIQINPFSRFVQDATDIFVRRLKVEHGAAPATPFSSDAQIAASAASITSLRQSTAQADEAIAQDVLQLSAVIADPASGLPATVAALAVERQARADQDEALSQEIEVLSAELVDPAGGLAATRAVVATNKQAQVDGDKALGEALTQVTTTQDGHTSTINLLLRSVDGQLGVAQLTVDVDGKISGFKIDGQERLFAIAADRFIVGNSQIFEVDTKTGRTVVNSLKAGTVEADTIVGGAVTKTVIQTTSAPIVLPRA